MPRCHRCNIDFRTRQNLVVHLGSAHPSASSPSMAVPTIYDLIVLLGRPRQTLFCPHPYCVFMVKDVASTRTLARHFVKKHPDHDLRIKYRCEECNIFVDPDRRAGHLREHLDYINCPNLSTTDYANVSIAAPVDESLHECPDSPRGRTLAPNPPYALPLVASSQSSGAPASPTGIPSTPKSQSPPTQPSIPNDIAISSQGSALLVSQTGSCTSSLEIPSDVRELQHSPPVSSTPNVFSGQSLSSPPQPKNDPSDLGTPRSSFSDSHHECDRASIRSQNIKDPSPPQCAIDNLVPDAKGDNVNPSVKACDPLSAVPSPPVSQSAEPELPPSSPSSWLSVSPNDSPLQRRLLIGPSSPPAAPTSKAPPPPPPPPQPQGNARRAPVKSSSRPTPCLAANDLRHRLITGAVPCNEPDRAVVADDSRRCYLKGRQELLVQLKRVCQDSDEILHPSSPSPPKVADIRHVIIEDSLPLSSSVEISSSPSSSRCDAANVGADANTEFALKVLRETFRNHRPPSPPPRSPSTAVGVIESPTLFDDPLTTSSRPPSPVAAPLPVTKQLRPVRSIYDPASHRRVAPRPSVSGAVAGLINQIRRASPPPPALPVEPVILESDNIDNVDDNIPSAQPRRPRPPDDVAADPPADPAPPAVNDPDLNDDLDASQELLMEPGDLDKLNEFRSLWIERFKEEHSWDEFCTKCEQFATEAREMAQYLNKPKEQKSKTTADPPPPPRRPANGRPFRRFNPVEARRIQGLYRHSKKRAARKLLNDVSVSYTGTQIDAETYFEGVLSEKQCNTNLLSEALRAHVPNGVDEETTKNLKDTISESEVAAKLRSAANTAPGADRVEYAHLKKIDPSGKILTPVFNTCLQRKNVPPIWKEAVTILIYKKGDSEDISNFRPIALMSCIYKLLMGILAKRITRWSIDAGILSAEQKSARPTEGCYEHTYVLKSLVGQARRNKKKLSLAWLDIRNAFGSVPHSAILTTLRYIGVPEELISLIMNAYRGASTTIKLPDGTTRAIPIQAGVKQGCPLSPILFNLCIELILRRVKETAAKLKSGQCDHYGTPISCLAYADDLVIIARSKQALQKLLDAASEAAHIIGFEFRPDKCATLSLTSTRQRATFVEQQDFIVQGNHIPALAQEESYRYLGVPIGLIHNIDDIPNIVPNLIKSIELIGNSLLAPWQKLDAIRTFVQPCLTYALRAGNPEMQSLDQYRSMLVRTLRDICNLPNRATAAYFFASKRTGGLSFQEPRTECDVQAIVQAVRILASQDPAVAAMARQELKYVVRRSTQSEPTPELLATYLSSTPDQRTQKLYYTYSSLWSRVRQACRRLKVTFHYSENNDITISADESERVPSRQVTTFLHRLVQSRYGDEFMNLKDQGKVARCLSEDQYGNGSTWHCTGLNLRFKDWRFIHRARLNVLPLNAGKSRFSNTDPACRRCAVHPETLPHVICHCKPHMVQIRDRHNSIVKRLTNSIRFGKITTDRTVEQSNLRLRPDIVVEEDNRVLIIDVTCPFDNDDDALSKAAVAKVNKYEPLKVFLESKGKSCGIYPFVVGALGSWYKQNEILLKKLGMTRRYKSLFRKLCCTDAIQGSNDIYRLHLGCDDATPLLPLE